MIPKHLIHIVKDEQARAAFDLDAVAAQNPAWQHIVLTDSQSTDFVRTHFPRRYLDALERIDPAYGPARSDVLRLLAIYHYGGVYLDTKSGATRPLDDILRDDDEFLLCQWGGTQVRRAKSSRRIDRPHPELAGLDGGEFVNWVLACRPRHPLIGAAIEQIVTNIETYSIRRFGVGRQGTLRVTGPVAYTLALWPLIEKYPHRRMKATECGFVYSRGQSTAHTVSKNLHYSRLIHPIIRPRGAAGLAWNCARPVALGIAWLRHYNRQRIVRRRVRRAAAQPAL